MDFLCTFAATSDNHTNVKKIMKLKICNWALLPVTVLMLASSIQLEFWRVGMPFIWAHIVIGVLFFMLIGWHLYLHFHRQNWFVGLKRQKSAVTKWLAVFAVATFLPSIDETIPLFITWYHATIGRWHGEIGYVFLALAIVHIVKRIRFYK